jgi:hypothetical protein
MSTQALTRFGQKLSEDSALQASVQQALGIPAMALFALSPEQWSNPDTHYSARLVEFAGQKGFVFSQEDLMEQMTPSIAPHPMTWKNTETAMLPFAILFRINTLLLRPSNSRYWGMIALSVQRFRSIAVATCNEVEARVNKPNPDLAF